MNYDMTELHFLCDANQLSEACQIQCSFNQTKHELRVEKQEVHGPHRSPESHWPILSIRILSLLQLLTY
jgi:hypothetical protein